jgi:hypothetical protein
VHSLQQQQQQRQKTSRISNCNRHGSVAEALPPAAGCYCRQNTACSSSSSDKKTAGSACATGTAVLPDNVATSSGVLLSAVHSLQQQQQQQQQQQRRQRDQRLQQVQLCLRTALPAAAGCYWLVMLFFTSVTAAGICHAAVIFTQANAPAPLKNSQLDDSKTLTCSSWVLHWSS